MSCSFWNMRRRLRAQQQKDKVIADIATAQAAEKTDTVKSSVTETPKRRKKAGAKNDSGTSTNS